MSIEEDIRKLDKKIKKIGGKIESLKRELVQQEPNNASSNRKHMKTLRQETEHQIRLLQNELEQQNIQLQTLLKKHALTPNTVRMGTMGEQVGGYSVRENPRVYDKLKREMEVQSIQEALGFQTLSQLLALGIKAKTDYSLRAYKGEIGGLMDECERNLDTYANASVKLKTPLKQRSDNEPDDKIIRRQSEAKGNLEEVKRRTQELMGIVPKPKEQSVKSLANVSKNIMESVSLSDQITTLNKAIILVSTKTDRTSIAQLAQLTAAQAKGQSKLDSLQNEIYKEINSNTSPLSSDEKKALIDFQQQCLKQTQQEISPTQVTQQSMKGELSELRLSDKGQGMEDGLSTNMPHSNKY